MESHLISPNYTAHCMGGGVEYQGLVISFLSLASLSAPTVAARRRRCGLCRSLSLSFYQHVLSVCLSLSLSSSLPLFFPHALSLSSSLSHARALSLSLSFYLHVCVSLFPPPIVVDTGRAAGERERERGGRGGRGGERDTDMYPAAERRGNTLNDSTVVRTEGGSSPGQNMTLTGLFPPSFLDSGPHLPLSSDRSAAPRSSDEHFQVGILD